MFAVGRLLVDLLSFLARYLPVRLGPSSARWLEAGLEEASREQNIRWAPRSPRSSTVVGTCEDFSVRVELEWKRQADSDNDQLHLCVTITGPRVPQGLAFAAERGTGDDVLTGDTVSTTW